MKPIHLTMEAFGPYGDTEVIDFRKLGATTLFLVSGETGSGKTAILDAICFALFGEASGRERQGHSMRSDHAEAGKLTRVTLEFEIKGIQYKATRTPRQERPKQRGEGTTTAGTTADLYQWTADRWDHLHTGTVPVGKALVDRIGFGADQFRQVIVLPQGEFRKLLTAGSAEREAIFAHLFETERYQQLQDRLKGAEAALKTALKEADLVRDTLLKTIEAENLEALKIELGERSQVLIAQEAEAGILQGAAQKTRDALERGRQATRALQEFKDATQALNILTTEKPSIDTDRSTSAAAEKAAALEGAERALTERQRDLKDATNRLEAAKENLETAQAQIGPATTAFEAEDSRKPERNQAHHHRSVLSALADAAGDWDRMLHTEARATKEVAHQDEQLAQAKKDVPLCADALDARKSDALKTRTSAETAVSLKMLIASLQAARVDIATLVDALTAGEPCRVCGSTDHPAPAHTPSVEDDATITRAQEELRLAQADAAALPTKDGATNKAQAKLNEVQEKVEKSRTLLEQAKEALSAARADRARLEEKVPEDLRKPGAIQTATDAAIARTQALDLALSSAQRRLTEVQSKMDSAKTQVGERSEACVLATTRQDDQATELNKRIDEAGFMSAKAYQLAKKEVSERHELRERIQRWDQGMKAATDRNSRAEKAAQGLTAPEMSALEAANEAAIVARTDHGDLTAASRDRVKQMKKALESIETIDATQAEQYAAHTVMGRLSEVANGTRGKRVTFERFVQAEILESVLVNANRRFHTMSSGRYQLTRATDSADRRKLTGLDLNVMDANTGVPRPAHTLSGGEGFEASLSLALGLADTVQARSGGIHLDSIFVDEGFGSLGGQDLDAVMQALQDLQDGGRLVGVISHVGEIAERIPTRLEVHKGHSGSHTRFVIP
jgi:exonuclease SbcC